LPHANFPPHGNKVSKQRTPDQVPSYVIHVGLHKTGSTYLQYRFREARAALAARGIVYPPQWENPRNFGHIVLANALACGNADSLIQDFAALNASDAGIVLISAEDLCNLDKAGLDTLKALTAGNRVDIVFVFRRWSALIPSIWQESIKQGNTATLTHFLLPHMMKPHMSRLLNLDLRLAPIVAASARISCIWWVTIRCVTERSTCSATLPAIFSAGRIRRPRTAP
jgi:hypothetical protein